MVDVLLEAVIDVNGTRRADFRGRELTPLWLAIEGKHRELVQNLLDHGAEVENAKQENLLLDAIVSKDHDIIQLVMAHASPDNLGFVYVGYTDTCGWISPLTAAIFKKKGRLSTNYYSSEHR
jgi:hypothetical protein